MRNLNQLVSAGIKASDLYQTVKRTMVHWTADDWQVWTQSLYARRAPGWKETPRSSHRQLERLAPAGVPQEVLNQLLCLEANQLLRKLHEDNILLKEWKTLDRYERLDGGRS